MHRTILNGAAIVSLAAAALLCPPARASEAEADPKDHCASAIDPFDPVEEFIRFCLAAGDDRSLDANEFHANRSRANPFVRVFDFWDQILRFDRTGDGTITWPEADGYRRQMRKAVLAAHDLDADGHLKGQERAAANHALDQGKVPILEPPAKDPAPENGHDEQPTTQPADDTHTDPNE